MGLQDHAASVNPSCDPATDQQAANNKRAGGNAAILDDAILQAAACAAGIAIAGGRTVQDGDHLCWADPDNTAIVINNVGGAFTGPDPVTRDDDRSRGRRLEAIAVIDGHSSLNIGKKRCLRAGCHQSGNDCNRNHFPDHTHPHPERN